MTTGTRICKLALRQIGVDSPLKPVNSESLDDSFDILNSMTAEWIDGGLTMAVVPLKVIGDDLSEPLGVRNAFIYNLATRLAPMFDVAVSEALSKQAMISFSAMQRQWNGMKAPKQKVRGTLPLGQGNIDYYNDFDDSTFFHAGDELG